MPFESTQVARAVPFDNSTNGFLSTDVQAAIEESFLFNPQYDLVTYDDTFYTLNWSPSTFGTGASALQGGGNATFANGKHNGVFSLETGTVIPGRAALRLSGTQQGGLCVGNGKATYESLIYIPDLSAALEEFVIRVGLADTNGSDPADGIYFEYDRTQSVNWRLRCASNSTRTTTTSSIAVAADVWIRLRWECDATATTVTYYIDGVNAGTVTTNIPTTTGRGYGALFEIIKTVGTTERSLYGDYFFYAKKFTSRD